MAEISLLQQVVDDHVNDPKAPRYTVVLKHHPGGRVVLPRGVRLHLDQCGPVVVESTGGNNTVAYTNGESLVVESMTDTELYVENHRGPPCDFLEVQQSRVKLVGVEARHVICEDSTVDLFDLKAGPTALTRCQVYWERVKSEVFTLSQVRGHGAELTTEQAEFLEDSEVYSRAWTTETFTARDSKVELTGFTATQAVELEGCNVHLDSCTFQGPLTLRDCNYYFKGLSCLEELSLEDCTGVSDSGEFAAAVTVSGGQHTTRNSAFEDTLEVTGAQWISDHDTFSEDLTLDTCRGNFDFATVTGKLETTNCALHLTDCTLEDDCAITGGTLPKVRRLSVAGGFSASGLQGRNQLAKVSAEGEFLLAGDSQAHLDFSESSVAGPLSLSGWGLVQLQSVVGEDSVSVSGIRSLSGGSLAGATLDLSGVLAILDGVTGDVAVANSLVQLKNVIGEVALQSSTFQLKGVSGQVTATGSAGSVEGAAGFSGSGCTVQLVGVANWAGVDSLLFGVGSSGPTIQADSSLLIKSPLIIIEGDVRHEGNCI